jgi:hypothetical protein
MPLTLLPSHFREAIAAGEIATVAPEAAEGCMASRYKRESNQERKVLPLTLLSSTLKATLEATTEEATGEVAKEVVKEVALPTVEAEVAITTNTSNLRSTEKATHSTGIRTMEVPIREHLIQRENL